MIKLFLLECLNSNIINEIVFLLELLNSNIINVIVSLLEWF
ncbi:hypothetical protein BMW23_0970 [Bodo saltans virus]|uniref:Uncharacterized protein n=1 Tax=Bodo saltans virus TaxID=2024608 RepID=A0A2H4UW01_9VIRU|nr:hypothetical protein QJ851_gp0952 [Bodo saltans virus]ATZ81015.1 hypothetical protein BMW23_0970 [Bodo saltans virus]